MTDKPSKTKIWSWFKRLESVMTLIAWLATTVLAVEATQNTTFYPYAKGVLNAASEIQSHTIYVEKIVTLRHTKTGEIRTYARKAVGGLFIQVDTPPVGSYIDKEWVVEKVEAKDLPVVFYLLLSILLITGIIFSGKGVFGFLKLPLVFAKTAKEIWIHKSSSSRFGKLRSLIFGLLAWFTIIFLVWSFCSLLKLLSFSASWLSDVVTPKGYALALVISVSISLFLTYIRRFENG